MNNRNITRPLSNQNGASVLFIVVAVPVMIVLVILVIDIGQMIFARIRLQTTVDACALAAATRQATGLNEIADLNFAAVNEFRNAKRNLEGTSWMSNPGASSGFTRQLRQFKNSFNSIQKQIRRLEQLRRNGVDIDRALLSRLRQFLNVLSRRVSMMSGLPGMGLPWENYGEMNKSYKHHKRALDKVDSLRKKANRHFYNSAHQYALMVKSRLLPQAELFSVGMNGRISETNLWSASGRLTGQTTMRKMVKPKFWAGYCTGKDCIPIWGSSRYIFNPDRYSDCGTLPAKMATTRYSLPTFKRPPRIPVPLMLKERWRKTSSTLTYAAYGLRQRQQSILLGAKLFDLRDNSLLSKLPDDYQRYIRRFLGPIKLPEMVVYAAAKPTGGHIFNTRAQYRPMMIRLNRVPVSGGVPVGLMEH